MFPAVQVVPLLPEDQADLVALEAPCDREVQGTLVRPEAQGVPADNTADTDNT